MPTPRSLKPGMAEALGHYVYLLIDPRDHRVFYVGKGQGDRCLQHFLEDDDSDKVRRIREIEALGLDVGVEVLAHGLGTAKEALAIESAAIELIGLTELTNKVRGVDSLRFGRKTLQELEGYYAAPKGDITDPVLLIRVSQMYRHGMSEAELYDITRGVWLLSMNRARGVRYVLSLYEGVVRGVFGPDRWQPADISGYPTRSDLVPSDAEGRVEFVGTKAPDDVQQRYMGKNLSAYMPYGTQSPVLYVNC